MNRRNNLTKLHVVTPLPKVMTKQLNDLTTRKATTVSM